MSSTIECENGCFEKRSNMQIKNISAVWNPACQSLKSKEDYRRYVDLPVRAAVRYLNNIGIRTNYSTANIEDTGEDGSADIRIFAYDLSTRNLQIAREMNLRKIFDYVWLEVPMSSDDKVCDICTKMLKIAKKFSINY